jgi:fucose permease
MTVVKTLTYLMFAMFAMTTDSVGLIIPEVIKTFGLSLTAAGTFQYATMAGIAVAALLFGQLADRFGRRPTIIVGLVLFAAACFLMAAGERFLVFAILLGLSGVAIGVFKTGALALIGDISRSTAQHTAIMNMAEGFFGVGAIVGPAILTRLLKGGLPWQWLYVIAGSVCVGLIVLAMLVKYPDRPGPPRPAAQREKARVAESVRAGVSPPEPFSMWVSKRPSTCGCRRGSRATPEARARWPPTASRSFFLLRAAGRFLGAWLLGRVRWQAALALIQRRHSDLLRAQYRRRHGWPSTFCPSRTVHVRDLSDPELQGDQLSAESPSTVPAPE